MSEEPPVAAVSDSSPLIMLAGIGRLSLLPELYGRVTIPPAVWSEVTGQGLDRRGAREVRSADWIDVLALRFPERVAPLLASLDVGEAEAICLARETGAGLLIVDDRRARLRAVQLGLDIIGTVGVLVDAKNAGLIDDVPALIDELERIGFRIGDVQRRHALSLIR